MEKMTSRIQKLEFLLKQMDKIHLRDAAEMLNVSEMTIRRDLVSCASSVILLGGYIVKDPKTHAQKGYRIFEQQEKNTAEKMYLGKLAASLIEDGDVVFLIVAQQCLLSRHKLMMTSNLPHCVAQLMHF